MNVYSICYTGYVHTLSVPVTHTYMYISLQEVKGQPVKYWLFIQITYICKMTYCEGICLEQARRYGQKKSTFKEEVKVEDWAY